MPKIIKDFVSATQRQQVPRGERRPGVFDWILQGAVVLALAAATGYMLVWWWA